MHPSAELYGSDRMTLESVRGLRDAGAAVTVVLGSDGPLREVISEVGASVESMPMPVLRRAALRPAGALRLLATAVRALPAMWRTVVRSRAGCLYVGTLTVPLWTVVARLRGMAVLVHVHEAEQSSSRWARTALAAPLLLADLVLVNSHASGAALTAVVPRLHDRIRLVPNGVAGPPDECGPPPAPPGPGEPWRLVQLGRISPRKGTDVAVRAVAELRAAGTPVHLSVVGGVFPGTEWFERDVAELVRRRGIADRVEFRGVVDEVWPELADAHIVIVPSREEPFGNVAVEAMLARRPVVVSATQGLREIVQPGETGEVTEPGDADALAAAVERVIGDWPAATARADRARTLAARSWSTDRYRADVVAAVAALGGMGRGTDAGPEPAERGSSHQGAW